MKFWQVDAFTKKIFTGNPAAVFIFEDEPTRDLMGKIANEMNLAETAFVIQRPELKIRWFTPECEVKLCGHATLSAAHILWEKGLLLEDKVQFQSPSGPLAVRKTGEGCELDFPAQPPEPKPEYKERIAAFLGAAPEYIGSNGEDCMAVVSDASIVRSFIPDCEAISRLGERGFLLTSKDPSGKYDYIYRAFFPKLGIPEDPVTGSANTCLAPYWSREMNRNALRAAQVSRRGGELLLKVSSDRLLITGDAVTVFEGEIDLDF